MGQYDVSMLRLVCCYMFGTSFLFCQSPKFHIAPQFDEVRPFHAGIAAVRQGEVWGFIDTAGAWVFTPRFATAILTEKKAYQVTDATNQVFQLSRPVETGAWALIPAPEEVTVVETSSGVRHIFRDGDDVGMRDAKGSILAQPVYRSITYIGHNLFVANVPRKGDCLMQADGKVLTNCFQEITPAVQFGRIRFRNDDQYGLMATDGRVIIPASLWRLEIAGRRIAYTHGGKLQLSTDQLELLYELPFDEVIYLDAEYWMAHTRDNGLGTIFDLDGRVVQPDIYVSDGRMAFGKLPAKDTVRGQWGYLNSRGEPVIPYRFGYTTTFWPDGKALFQDPDQQGRYKKGLLDTSGQIALPAAYNDIFRHPDGVYTVVQDGKAQLLDANLKVLTPPTGKMIEYIGNGVYVEYSRKKSLQYQNPNWYTGEKGGLYIRREAQIAAVYALDGQLLLRGKEVAENEPLPEVSEGLAAAKKNGKWGFVRCTAGL